MLFDDGPINGRKGSFFVYEPIADANFSNVMEISCNLDLGSLFRRKVKALCNKVRIITYSLGVEMKKRKRGRWFKYNLTLTKERSSMGAYAETSETRCPGDIASCDGTGDRRNQHI